MLLCHFCELDLPVLEFHLNFYSIWACEELNLLTRLQNALVLRIWTQLSLHTGAMLKWKQENY